MRALVEQTQVELDRLQVKSPIAATILKVDVRPGEFVGTTRDQELIVLGDIDVLHVRVDIDEQDLPRFQPGLPGRGFVRGDASKPLPLEFVRVEPYAQPKKSLTGSGTERVDTRVLQVIYAIGSTNQTIYVGQQIDVYLNLEHQ
jgi:multidrug efflux pump subunit AcrA (membrane-fusion protein)